MLTSVFLYTACEAQTKKTTNNINQIDSLILVNDSVFISRIKTFELISTKEKKVGVLEYIVRDTPTKEQPYYIIQVGKTNSYRLEIFYNFYCYPRSGDIKLYDALNDTLINPLKK